MSKGFGIDANDITVREHIIAGLKDNIGHYPVAPVFLADVVSHFGGEPVYVSLTEHTYASDSLVVHGYRKGKCAVRIGRKHRFNKFGGVIFGVGIRQTVPQIIKHFSV